MYLLYKNDPVHLSLRRVLLETTSESIELLRNTGEQPDLAVHEIRKNIKRVRACLRLSRGLIARSDYRTTNLVYRDLGRHFSELRDSTVLAETLASVYASAELLPETIEALDHKLAGDFQTETDRSAWFTDEKIAALETVFRVAGRQVEAIQFDSLGWHALSHGLRWTAGKAKKDFVAAYQSPESPEKFHEWRKLVKYLWHQFELLFDVSGEAIAERTVDLKHLSDLLGQAHDAAVLQSWLKEKSVNLRDPQLLELSGHARRYRMDHEGAARPHGIALFSQPVDILLAWFLES